MIKTIYFDKYKKLIKKEKEPLIFNFTSRMNIISGTNGTCKTTLLHIISNSFKAPILKSDHYVNSNCIRVIKKNNAKVNPKIEALVRDAQNYSDPSGGLKGTLFEIEYINKKILKFRKHNSENKNRYAIKPYYPKGAEKQYLPSCLVIYLGLSRLFPIDDNTTSSGENNVMIIIKALVSLAFYYNSLRVEDRKQEVISILSIDKFDATLPPICSGKAFRLYEYSEKYKLSLQFTVYLYLNMS